ncbi:PadR family transcriptional regulator [Psychromicrobium lacuslunae]|uniref:Transcriptional regulator n=1 Tax=Psychromicrobium lacuslunae TaxID=1618207 RepID=A0A0D4BWR5_9MICC|nr:PadR family transcriptional regulator [Psychromicrobium lacuslunae]AJT40541.1 transcriptional regulator [Psychromicrobium lacuslunae]
MAPYSTRLLVLGVVRIFQPAHGYLLLQELNSWQVDRWANVKPGSIYSALRTLAKEGLLEVVQAEQDDSVAKASYQITEAGLTEFSQLFRQSIADVASPTIATSMAGIAFLPFFNRAEVTELLRERASRLERGLQAESAAIAQLSQGQPDVPPHVLEHHLFSVELLRGNLNWTAAALNRIESGDYAFAGEPPVWSPPADDPIWGNSRQPIDKT